MMNRWIGLALLCLLAGAGAFAQEGVAPLRMNKALDRQTGTTRTTANRGTAATLPFFEDFTDDLLFPNPARWEDSNVYLNNTMGVGVISRGVATFDALNKYGRPHDTVDRLANSYADSLTSLPFNLSVYTPGDNIYLSFFYQPQGNGFSPDPGDSLMLFFRKSTGGWGNVWGTNGTSLQPFRQVLIPVTDTGFLFNGFQFRFVNRTMINTNDDIWNLDYIRMATNRNANDTTISDLAFTTVPTNLLNDYTAMPYRHFLANANLEQAANISDTFRNLYGTNATVNYGYTAQELRTGTALSASTGTINVTPRSSNGISFPNYVTTSVPASGRLVFETKYYLQSGNPNEPKSNDTNIHRQIFDNYFAYDDGSAEQSYFLNLFPTVPGKLAIEYRLNQPDTLRGIAIYFGQQVPTAANKPISVLAYKTLQGIGNAPKDSVIARLDNRTPLYTDSINKFTIYRFDQPVPVDAGTFYIGYIQPANSGSDSLYIGLDVNRVGGNHVYYNVLNRWQSSNVSGALMIRPLVGGAITGTGVGDIAGTRPSWSVYPNPAGNTVFIRTDPNVAATQVSITDIAGREVQLKAFVPELDLALLSPGIYFVRIRAGGQWSTPKKIIKQ